MAQNFYKYDGSYYLADTHKKILNTDELKKYSQSGGKEITYQPDSSWMKIPNPEAISQYDVKGQYGSTLYGTLKTPTLPATLNSSIISTGLNNDISGNLPPTTSQTINDAFLNSSLANVETQKKNIFDIYQKQADEAKAAKEKAQAEIDAMRKQQEETLKETDPTKSQYYDQQQRITQDRLDAAETASGTLEKNFTDNQNSISELETLLKTAQAKIEAEQNRPALESVSQGRVNNIKTDYAGRVGVLQAVISARNGQINMANTLINEAFDTVSAQRTDYLNYANAVLNLMETKVGDAEGFLIEATKDEKEAIKNQISMVENELKESEETKQVIMNLMIEQPDLADKAGLSLTDTKEEIAQKIQTYYKAHPEAMVEKNTEWKTIGKDIYGNDIYGFVDTDKQTVIPYGDVNGQISAEGTYGGQCGDYIHNIMNGTPQFGDTWESKQKAMNITSQEFASSPQVGDIVAFKTNLPQGHVATVAAINGDGTFTVTESNYGLDEKISNNRKVNLNDPSILGVYRGATFKKQIAPITKQNLVKIDGVDYQLMPDGSLQKPQLPQTDTTKEDTVAKGKAQIALGLKDHQGLEVATGFYLGRGQLALSPTKLAAKEDFIASVEQLVSGLSLDALIEAKAKGATFGALSDTEMRILASSATKIGSWKTTDKNGKVTGYKAGEAELKKELGNISNTLNSYIKDQSNKLQSSMSNYTVGTIIQDASGKKYKVINSNGDVEEIK